jgi:pyridoxal phosphate enzyme (YggS family)
LNEIAKNLETVRDHMSRAAQRVGRDPRTIRLVAATKFVPVDRIREALEAGVTICGENRWQEAQVKMDTIETSNRVVWHFLGRLQRRKLRQMVGQFALIHSVESCEQAKELNLRAHERGIEQPVLLEVNVGGEATKGGFSPEVLLAELVTLDQLSSVKIQGLMTLPPRVANPEDARPYFRKLKALAEEVKTKGLVHIRMDELSMGMSQDYEIAIEEGATYIRVGTVIFGERKAALESVL